MSSRKVRWGVVGTGGIGRRTVGDLGLCETAEVVAVASRDQQRADAFAADLGITHAFGSYTDLCASADVDVDAQASVVTSASVAHQTLRPSFVPLMAASRSIPDL